MMITRSYLAYAAPLCALLYFSCGCASHQMLAIKNREIRDLRQQNAGRQEAFVKALKTVESLRAELGSVKYEKRELEQKVASSAATTRIQQQSIDRLEAQKAKLQEQLRQSELAYERLRHTYQDIKSVLSTMMTELAQARSEPETTGALGQIDPSSSEHTRLKRKVEELRTQVIRERAARRTAELNRPPPPAAPSPPRDDSSPWVWRLTEQPPEVDTVEPGTLAVDGETKPDADDAASSDSDVLGTAFLWTLGAIPAIGVTLLMFIVLVRVLSRPSRDTRETHQETGATNAEEESRIESLRDDAESLLPEQIDQIYERMESSAREDEREDSDEDRGLPAAGDEGADPKESAASADSGQAEASEPAGDRPAETAFIDSLDWLDETKLPEKPEYSQDTEAVELPDASADARAASAGTDPQPKPPPSPHPAEPVRSRRVLADESSDTQPHPAEPVRSRRVLADESSDAQPHPAEPVRSRRVLADGSSDTQPHPAEPIRRRRVLGDGSSDTQPHPDEPIRRRRVLGDGGSDTQMIERIDGAESGATQVLPNLYEESEDEADTDRVDRTARNQEFTETSVLDVEGVRAEENDESAGTGATETQVLPPLLDFEDESELDEALAETSESDGEEESLGETGKTDGELLAELEDLMGEKFEETV